MDFVFWEDKVALPSPRAASVPPTPHRTSDRPVGGDRVRVACRSSAPPRKVGEGAEAQPADEAAATASQCGQLTRQTPFLRLVAQAWSFENRRGGTQGGEPAALRREEEMSTLIAAVAEWERPCGALGPQADALPRDQGRVHVPGRDGRRDHRALLRVVPGRGRGHPADVEFGFSFAGFVFVTVIGNAVGASPRCSPASRIAGSRQSCGCRSFNSVLIAFIVPNASTERVHRRADPRRACRASRWSQPRAHPRLLPTGGARRGHGQLGDGSGARQPHGHHGHQPHVGRPSGLAVPVPLVRDRRLDHRPARVGRPAQLVRCATSSWSARATGSWSRRAPWVWTRRRPRPPCGARCSPSRSSARRCRSSCSCRATSCSSVSSSSTWRRRSATARLRPTRWATGTGSPTRFC